MNAIRIAMTVFILILIVLSTAGWIWWGSNAAATAWAVGAARVVLTLGMAAGVVGLIKLWRVKPLRALSHP